MVVVTKPSRRNNELAASTIRPRVALACSALLVRFLVRDPVATKKFLHPLDVQWNVILLSRYGMTFHHVVPPQDSMIVHATGRNDHERRTPACRIPPPRNHRPRHRRERGLVHPDSGPGPGLRRAPRQRDRVRPGAHPAGHALLPRPRPPRGGR